MTSNGPVLVGVTGRGENSAALQFAAQEAAHRGGEVLLVHALSPSLPPPPSSMPMAESWVETGRAILEAVRDEIADVSDPGITINVTLEHGSPVEVLSRLSQNASLVVLQHRDLSRVRRFWTRSTAAAVATHAHCPVVSVPERESDRKSVGRVVVGVHEDGSPAGALEAAFSEAENRGASLLVSNSWRFAATYDDLLDRDDSWKRDAESLIEQAVDECRPRHPGVDVELVIRHEWPDEALAELSADADLVVVGRHGSRPPFPQFLGSVARGVLQQAQCPVMVVPVGAAH